jgi:lysophospholipase L1-like esterase
MKVGIWGDSIAHGVGDCEMLGWGNRVRAALFEKVEVYVRAIRGDTSRDLLKRFEVEYRSIRPEIIIIAIGTNDSSYLSQDQDNTLVSLNGFESNLKKIMEIAASGKIIFVGLSHVDEKLVSPLTGSTTGKCYSNKTIERFDQEIKHITTRTDNVFVSLLEHVQLHHLDDGLHPNAAGHEIITTEVVRALKRLV